MIRLEMKSCSMILTEKLAKYQLYHQTKLVSMNILLVKKYYHIIKKYIYSKLNLLILLWEQQLNKKNTNKNNRISRKKQVEALQDLKQEEQKKIYDQSDDKLSIQKENCDRLLNKRVDEIRKNKRRN